MPVGLLKLTKHTRSDIGKAGNSAVHKPKMERVFDQGGPWAIVLTRSLPYSIPEAMVLIAGLAGMPRRTFTIALITGSVPTAFVFAAIGAG